MEFFSYLSISTSILFLVFPCNVSPKSQPGLFDVVTFTPAIPKFNLIDPNSGISSNNNQKNINLISLFPQNNNIIPTERSQLDPNTREELSQQKEKLENILEKLKELNKQKEEAQKNPMGNTGYDINNSGYDNNGYDNNGYDNNNGYVDPNVYNNNNKNDFNNNNGYNNGLTDNTDDNIYNTKRPIITTPPSETKTPKIDVWETLSIKKFVFQARPVKPENEIEKDELSQTLYFVQ